VLPVPEDTDGRDGRDGEDDDDPLCSTFSHGAIVGAAGYLVETQRWDLRTTLDSSPGLRGILFKRANTGILERKGAFRNDAEKGGGAYHQSVPKYSIVVPFHNEEDNVTALYDRVKLVMEQVAEPFEMVFVDDGSRDRTYRLLEEIAAVDSRVLVIRLRRNFGQTSALAAGFDHAQGEFVISMDGDLQHDPEEIPNFIARLEEGYDVVSGWRAQRGDNLLLRRIPSACANWMMARVSGVEIHDFGTTFKAYRREVIHNIPLYGEMHRFIPALASWYGASICEIPITNPARQHGQSHYGIGRTVRVFFDLMTIRFLLRYMTRPLHFFGSIGALGMLSGGALAMWLLVVKLMTGQHVLQIHGPLFIVAGVLLLGGIQMLGIGLLGELQVRHFHTPSHRAPYAIDRILRLRSSEESLMQ
jgi:glycosyltransferase involved in cell wall biosynthesis